MKVAFTQVLFTQVAHILHFNYCHVCPASNSIPFFCLLEVVQKSTARNLLKCICVFSVHYKAAHAKFWKDMVKKWVFVSPRVGDQCFFPIIFSLPFFQCLHLSVLQRYKIFNITWNSAHCSHHIFKTPKPPQLLSTPLTALLKPNRDRRNVDYFIQLPLFCCYRSYSLIGKLSSNNTSLSTQSLTSAENDTKATN